MTIEGAVDTQVFDLYVEHLLVPELIEGDIVLLDNIKMVSIDDICGWFTHCGYVFSLE